MSAAFGQLDTKGSAWALSRRHAHTSIHCPTLTMPPLCSGCASNAVTGSLIK